MKKVFYGMFAFVMALVVVPAFANAAEVEVATEADLVSCVAEDNTCKLTANIILENLLDIKKEVVIDLNGHSIVAGDELTFNGNMIQILHGAKLTVKDSGEGGLISTGDSGKVWGALGLTKKNETDITKTAILVIEGGIVEGFYYGISGNGNADRINTSITINGGIVRSISEDSGLGIFHPQDGSLTVNGGTITGATGIEMRAGTLVVNGGSIIATGTPLDVNPNGSGSTTFGAGIAIAQHTTLKNIDVTVNGGEIKGFSALYESNPQNNTEVAEKVSVAIKGGSFEATNNGTVPVYSETLTNFIEKGEFGTEVDEKYLSNEVVTEEENGVHFVGEKHAVTVGAAEHGTAVTDKTEAILGQTVKVTATPGKDYELDKIIVAIANGEVEVKADGTFVMPDEDVTVTVTFKENVNPDTSDNILVYFIMGFTSLAVIAGVSLKIKKSIN